MGPLLLSADDEQPGEAVKRRGDDENRRMPRQQRESFIVNIIANAGRMSYEDTYGKLTVVWGGVSLRAFEEYVTSAEWRGQIVSYNNGVGRWLYSPKEWELHLKKGKKT